MTSSFDIDPVTSQQFKPGDMIRIVIMESWFDEFPGPEQIYSTIDHQRIPVQGVLLVIGYDEGVITFLSDKGLFSFHKYDIASWVGTHRQRLYVQHVG